MSLLRTCPSMRICVAVMALAPASWIIAGTPLAWVQRASTGPSPRVEYGFAYDSARGVVVLFGGANNLSFTSVFADTWEWDGSSWSLRATTGPSARCDNAMAFDSDRSVTVSFGGYSGAFFGDTWEWNGATWVLRTSIGPQPRADSFMVYDAARKVMVLFGGLRANNTIAGDTWEYDGVTATWTLRSNAGPPPRWIARMSYDAARSVTVLFGGAGASGALGDTWEWDGTAWMLRADNGPSARYGNAMAFDHHRGVSLIFGGGTTFGGGDNQTWEYDGAAAIPVWTQHLLPSPSPRTFVKMAFDSARCRMVLFGGYGGAFLQDTWELGIVTPGDVDCDGLVDISDLLAVINQWGDCLSKGACSADVAPPPDGDGVVDVSDLLLVINQWT